MVTRPTENDDEIDLPPKDGGAEDEGASEPEDLDGEDVLSGEGDLDDSTGESDPIEDLPENMSDREPKLADGAEANDALDVGNFDVFGDEQGSLLSDAEEPGTADETLDIDEQDETLRDAGEEGPAAEGDDIGIEDLPPIDADEEGAGDESAFSDEIPDEISAPWDDAAWEKVADYLDVAWREKLAELGVAVPEPDEKAEEEPEGDRDSEVALQDDRVSLIRGRGVVIADEAVPGTTSVCAAVRVGNDVACARTKPALDATAIFLWSPERGARTIAEVGTSDSYEVSLLAWDESRGILWAAGEFGLIGLKPPHKRPT